MAITLVTGQPGHGKTQWAIGEAMRLAKAGRTVYAGNIRGLDYDAAGFQKLDRLEAWEALPDGSVVLWDECYDALPQRSAGKKTPGHIEALARHRHRGFDFLLVCQQTKQLDSFVSGLIERHLHVERKFGTSLVRIKEWSKWQQNVERAPLVTHTWKLQPAIWKLYESATVHTVKRRFPWYLWALPLLLGGTLWMLYSIPGRFLSKADVEASGARTDAAQAAAGSAAGAAYTGEGIDLMRLDPETALRPRIDGAPWSAPAYDDVKFAPPPRLACMSSADSCTCITVGHGTVYGTSDYTCRLIARLGYYDPTHDITRQRVADAPRAEPRVGR